VRAEIPFKSSLSLPRRFEDVILRQTEYPKTKPSGYQDTAYEKGLTEIDDSVKVKKGKLIPNDEDLCIRD
jgi:hypothetical protein